MALTLDIEIRKGSDDDEGDAVEDFFQRGCAAALAISARCFGVRALARALPPLARAALPLVCSISPSLSASRGRRCRWHRLVSFDHRDPRAWG